MSRSIESRFVLFFLLLAAFVFVHVSLAKTLNNSTTEGIFTCDSEGYLDFISFSSPFVPMLEVFNDSLNEHFQRLATVVVDGNLVGK